MKKLFAIILSIAVLASCANAAPASSENPPQSDASSQEELTVLKVGATAAPHAEILEQAAPILEKEGIKLEITVFDDYVLPNLALAQGDLSANYFQHQPYLDFFNENNNTDLISAGSIHYEPLGIYPGKAASIEELADGAQIAVPNDGSNEARALYLLEDKGLIKIDHTAGYEATKLDISENPRNFDIVELDADKIPAAVQDVELAVINGNYAIAAGINETVLVSEDPEGDSAVTYANIVAVRPGDKDNEQIKKLVEVLKSDEIVAFMREKYKGSVEPV